MKTIALSLSLLLSLALKPFSCNKQKSSIPVNEIVGTWSGTYTVDQLPELSPQPYSFTISAGGELLTQGRGADGVTYYHKGTWRMDGNTFTATYTTINRHWSEVTQSATMTWSDGRFINAAWTDVKNPDGHLDGKFQKLKKVSKEEMNSL